MLMAFTTVGQEVKYCGQVEVTEKLFQHFPQLRAKTEQAHLDRKIRHDNLRSAGERGGGDEEVYFIPVVFHIVHQNGEENISDAQVEDAMFILNRDFRLQNEDVENVVPAFYDLASDIQVEFRLAKRDPQGNCTNGIIRYEDPTTNEGGSDMKDAVPAWPRDKYMNVWVCAYAQGAAGYTFLPSSVDEWWMADQDGVVILHDYVGASGTSNALRSRALTHEVGHWLGLPHPWGPTNSPGLDNNCQYDDNINDTPNTIGWQSCTLDGESCGSADNVQNYMEYSYCSRMFTEDQRYEMRYTIQNNIADRGVLVSESNHEDTGIFEEDLLCAAQFQVSEDIICAGDSVQFFDYSFHGVTSWEWDFGTFQISGDDEEEFKNPVITFDEAGTYSVTLTVSNGNTSVSETINNMIYVVPAGALPTPFQDGFEEGIVDFDWFIWNEHANVGWEETSTASYSGNSCVRIRNRNNDILYSKDHLTSSTLDLSSAVYATVSYKYAYCNMATGDTDDRLRIDASGDCGETWLLQDVHRGITDLPTAPAQNSPFTPSGTDEWAEGMVVIDNEVLLSPFFRLRFNFEGRFGNNVYLDDINITVYDEETSVTTYFNDFKLELYPNPANQTAQLSYYLPAENDVRITLHDAVGKQVQEVFNGGKSIGQHTDTIDRQNLPSGMYLVNMQIGERTYTQRLILQ